MGVSADHVQRCRTSNVDASHRRHVFRDLRPYVYTFQDCKRSEHLYENVHDWFGHEGALHRREWLCSAYNRVFPSRVTFQHHMSQSHVGQFSPHELPVVIERLEPATESEQNCNLCGQKAFPLIASSGMLDRRCNRLHYLLCRPWKN